MAAARNSRITSRCRTTTAPSASRCPAGADRLNASIAYPGNPANGNNSPGYGSSSIDPLGRFAAHSLPQGVGNFGNVGRPRAGPGHLDGRDLRRRRIRRRHQRGHSVAGVHPALCAVRLRLPRLVFPCARPERRPFEVTASTPSNRAMRLRIDRPDFDQAAASTTMWAPRATRSRSRCAAWSSLARAAASSGVLTGGNGRPPGQGQVDYYEFNVGPGHGSITANVSADQRCRRYRWHVPDQPRWRGRRLR